MAGGIGLQPCIMCCLSRRLVGAEPVAKIYEIQTLECAECESVVGAVDRDPAVSIAASMKRRRRKRTRARLATHARRLRR